MSYRMGPPKPKLDASDVGFWIFFTICALLAGCVIGVFIWAIVKVVNHFFGG